MSFFEIDGTRHPIPPGEFFIGSDASSFITLTGASVTPRHLSVHSAPDGQTSVSRADEGAETFINGIRLGPQPTPLLHGDKIELGDHELLFVDERRSGSTQFVSAEDLAKFESMVASGPKKPAVATASTGGRLVSLTDGREYTVLSTPLVIGRDAGCDVVVASKRVSRRHAEIVSTPKGYLLVDASTNGTFVNGDRLEGEVVLSRGDVIRVGDDEFRFYADTAPAAPVAGEPAAPPPAPAPAPVPPPAPAAPPGVEHRLSNTVHGMPAPPRPAGASYRLSDTMHGVPEGALNLSPRTGESEASKDGPPAAPPPGSVLANLLGRSGPFKGQRFPIRVPVVNIGRADYNDIVLADDTVSTIHAKLQRREGIWVLVDLDSTNGTFVDAERISGDMPLAPGAIVRFGDVSMVFEPTDDSMDMKGGGSTTVLGALKLPEPGAGGAGGQGSVGEGAAPPPKTDKDRSARGLWPFRR